MKPSPTGKPQNTKTAQTSFQATVTQPAQTTQPASNATATRPTPPTGNTATPPQSLNPTNPPAVVMDDGFTDDFSDPQSGWYTGDTENYLMGYTEPAGFEIMIKRPNFYAWAIRPEIFTNVVVSFRGYLGGHTGSYLGAICRYQDANNFYSASISGDSYNIGKIVSGQWVDLTSPNWLPLPNPITDPAQGFLVSLQCYDDSLSLMVEYDRLPAVMASDIRQGGVGMLAGGSDSLIGGYYANAVFEDFVAGIP